MTRKKSNLNNMFGSVLITHQTATPDLIQEQQKLKKVTSGWRIVWHTQHTQHLPYTVPNYNGFFNNTVILK